MPPKEGLWKSYYPSGKVQTEESYVEDVRDGAFYRYYENGNLEEEKNYLSCSVDVKSEIVMPVFRGGRLVGELDIDSHSLSPFSSDDVEFLEEVCRKVSVFFGGEGE